MKRQFKHDTPFFSQDELARYVLDKLKPHDVRVKRNGEFTMRELDFAKPYRGRRS